MRTDPFQVQRATVEFTEGEVGVTTNTNFDIGKIGGHQQSAGVLVHYPLTQRVQFRYLAPASWSWKLRATTNNSSEHFGNKKGLERPLLVFFNKQGTPLNKKVPTRSIY